MTDYISREAAYPLAKKICDAFYDDKHSAIEMPYLILDWIDDIPADDVRPVVRAEFVRCGDGKGVPYMCSHCGRTTPANMVEIWGVNFCPNCGADMRGEADHV